METEAFFDTNILVYVVSAESDKADRAETLLKSRGMVSTQVLSEFVDTVIRKRHIPISKVRSVLSRMRRFFDVWAIDEATHDLALDIMERYGFRIYDCTIVASALLGGATTLYSEDLQHGQRIGNLTIHNPFQ